ncbi:MAG: hypothetical protein GY749_17240 [Desulfobacteraceae bacterium]|nr:hypothetical protein [Desulfobacteraceae bacterium]
MGNRTGSAWPLYTVWIIVFVTVAAITLTLERESTSFHGIAETREIVINSESMVEIKRINVVEGQSVTMGQLLVELVSPELNLRINHISHQLDQLKAQKGVNKAEIRSRIKQLKAEKVSRTSEISNQIRQFENQYNINKELTSGLKSISSIGNPAKSGASNPITLKIESLRQELALSLRPVNIQIDLLQKSLDSSESPIKIQVEQLEKELAMLKQEDGKLNIYAQLSGFIGSVNFKPGEKAAPFAPILTLHSKNPSFVKGYIHENVYTHMTVGKNVHIKSQADSKNAADGTVVGVGARIVEYPVRLRKNPDLQIWGREVVIRIPETNRFILGEKVMINASGQKATFVSRLKSLFLPRELLAEDSPVSEPSEKTELASYTALPVVPLETSGIEASALLWLDDIEQYLVLSDDTPGNRPLLFLMDKYGRIIKETSVKGLKKINDMESVAMGQDGTIYIASSSSLNKNGKLGKFRRLLVSLKREKDKFSLVKKIDLYGLLEKTAHSSKAEWAGFILDAIKDRSLDIEGMFCRAGSLYLGFKSPFRAGNSVILKIDGIDNVFDRKKLGAEQVSVWKTLFMKPGDALPQESISDLYCHNGVLYITGTSSANKSGNLWKLDETTGKLARIAAFDGLRPEGISAGKENGTLMISFDQGNDGASQIAVVRVAS